MNEEAFRKTVIETLRYDNKWKVAKATLMPIITRSEINSVPQFAFATRSYQHWEDIELRVPVPLINLANEYEGDISKLFRYVYQETPDYDLQDIHIKPKIIGTEEEDYVENDVVFNEIQDTLIQGIRDAKYLIWISVAWFSNEVFYNELLKKKQSGLNIRIIVSDEESNRNLFPKLEKEFDCIKIPHFGNWGKNLMHHKFCIVDMEYVMHGSYNWTKAANYNWETLETSIDRELVKKFADQFIKMYTEGKNTDFDW
jgi:phosphatidylserine/phosphatidylglycerophosphate/cardiolipin synthase-like enzyme